MARNFDGSTQYLHIADGIIPAGEPFSFSCWFFPTDNTASQTVFSLEVGDGSGNHDWVFLMMSGVTANDPVVFGFRDAATRNAMSTVDSPVFDAWNHACGYLTGNSTDMDARLWLNGVDGGINSWDAPSTSTNITNPTNSWIGARSHNGTVEQHFAGRVAELAFWDRQLTASELLSMQYVSPYSVAHDNRVEYRPFGGIYGEHDKDIYGLNGDLTANGSPTWADHPPIIYPSVPFQQRATKFDQQRQAIIDGLTSAQSEATGWNAKVRDIALQPSDVVRTSDTVVTISLPAVADYDISAGETITATIPAAALTGAAELVAAPTFTVDTAGGSTNPEFLLTMLGI